MIDYKKLNENEIYRYMFKENDNVSEYLMCVPLQNKNSQTITQCFSITLTTLKRSPVKKESDRGVELYSSIFQNFLKGKNIHHYSGFTDKGPNS